MVVMLMLQPWLPPLLPQLLIKATVLTPLEVKLKKVKKILILTTNTPRCKFLQTMNKFDIDPTQWQEQTFRQNFGGDLFQDQLLLEKKLQNIIMDVLTFVEDHLKQIDDLSGFLANINAEVDEVRLRHTLLNDVSHI